MIKINVSLGFLVIFWLYCSQGTLPSIAMCPLIILTGTGWGCWGVWNGRGRVIKQKLPLVQPPPSTMNLSSEHPCMDPNTAFLISQVALNRSMFNIGRYRHTVGLYYSTLINHWRRLLSCHLEVFTPSDTPGTVHLR